MTCASAKRFEQSTRFLSTLPVRIPDPRSTTLKVRKVPIAKVALKAPSTGVVDLTWPRWANAEAAKVRKRFNISTAAKQKKKNLRDTRNAPRCYPQ